MGAHRSGFEVAIPKIWCDPTEVILKISSLLECSAVQHTTAHHTTLHYTTLFSITLQYAHYTYLLAAIDMMNGTGFSKSNSSRRSSF